MTSPISSPSPLVSVTETILIPPVTKKQKKALADLVSAVEYIFPTVETLMTVKYGKIQNLFKLKYGPMGAKKKWRRALYMDAQNACLRGKQSHFVKAITTAFPKVDVLFDDVWYTFWVVDLQFIAYLRTRKTDTVRWFKSKANKGDYDAEGVILRFYHWPQGQGFTKARDLFREALKDAPGLVEEIQGERRTYNEKTGLVKNKGKKGRAIYLVAMTPVPILAQANGHHVKLTEVGVQEVVAGLAVASTHSQRQADEQYANKMCDPYQGWLKCRQEVSTLELALIYSHSVNTRNLSVEVVEVVAAFLHAKAMAA